MLILMITYEYYEQNEILQRFEKSFMDVGLLMSIAACIELEWKFSYNVGPGGSWVTLSFDIDFYLLTEY